MVEHRGYSTREFDLADFRARVEKQQFEREYSADDIWGVGIYSKTFPSAGKHKVKISVLGQPPDAFGTGTSVYLDGLQVEP